VTSKRSFLKALGGLAGLGMAARQAVAATWQSLTGGSGSGGYTLGILVSSNQTDYNMRTAAIAAGWNGTSAVNLTVMIQPGVTIDASATTTYAFDTGAPWPAGSTLTLINNGTIRGKGGLGSNSGDGQAGGPALRAQFALAVTNNGTIGGGGGGGGYASGGAGNGAGGNGAGPGAATGGGAAYYYSYECL